MRHCFNAAAALAATFSFHASASSIPQCGAQGGYANCPSSSPCCSQYGQCGVGAYCLGGCDPRYSFDIDSCMPAPICKSADYKLTSLTGITPNTQYLGDVSNTNWVSSGTPVVYNDQSILLTMAPSTSGTLLMSAHYVWYGKISATLSTSQGQGVVTAFILMSDVQDEIDFEFVGVDLTHAQTNYYFQGITDYNNGGKSSTSNTVQTEHTYTIDWQPDQLTWAIDGTVSRTLYKKDTWNSTDNKYHYPQTPSRVQLSLWPAGLSTNGQGTIAWAGGLINWNSPYMQNGYYYAVVKEVSVQCYSPPSDAASTSGSKSYYYVNTEGLESDVAIGNNNTILGSFFADGEKPGYNPSASTTGGSQPTKTPQTVPGIVGGGNQQIGGGNGGASASASGPAGSLPTGGGGGGGGFVQGGGTSEASTVVAGSAVALLGFFVAALML